MSAPLLEIQGIKVRYSGLPVLHGVTLTVNAGETVCVVGANGAGKSTILRAVMGAQRAFEGQILFSGRKIQQLRTEEIVRRGIVYVPEEKMLFRPLSVEENLMLGAYILSDPHRIQENLDFVYALFPRLKERRLQPASTLSGGEQQMVAIGRGLMSRPQILMLDEPSLGLAPKLVDEVLDTVRRLKAQGMTILLVEQNVREALDLADRGYVIQTGRIVREGGGKELLASDTFQQAFLGI
ncbi:MAG TPA: ABC transporter ATP-binding protein [Desulfobacterales bacterium]|nr:ABC transporter ATP-binding protein [Desulfobacterales bacterium]